MPDNRTKYQGTLKTKLEESKGKRRGKNMKKWQVAMEERPANKGRRVDAAAGKGGSVDLASSISSTAPPGQQFTLLASPNDFSLKPLDSSTLLKRRKRKMEMAEVQVVEGSLAALPCSLEVETPQDSVQIILWIKEGIHTPLYSYDYRELLGGRPKETKPDANSTLARRTTFRTDTSPAALVVERVEADDAGIYRCRVDYLLSPTRNTRVNLTVVVPPSRARISWRLGNSGLMPVETPVVGPFLEGANPTIVCSNDDGWPLPAVVWYEGATVLDDTYGPIGEEGAAAAGGVSNELSLAPLTRDDLGRRLTCNASNSNKTQPATTTVTLDMTLSIVGVRVEEVTSAWAGEETQVVCKVWGSRPPPTVVWWLGSTMLSPSQIKVVEEGNVTLSILRLTPRPQDDAAMLICQATNEKLPDQAVQDSRLLSVSYAPLVSVSLGRSLHPDRIKEGDDVYFECSVTAKPAIFKVGWRHNGVQLVAGEGVFVSNMSLVVQRVTRAHGGNYTCEATNVKATSSSPPLHLDVKYAPVCAQQQRTQHSVAKLENAEISCRVHANPPTVTFRWTFNNTAEAIDVPDGRFVVAGTESRVNYTPLNELDYGTLLCWANNTIGVQERPCVFHVVAAGKPDPPHNCRVYDVTISSLQVACLPGDDGGLTQNFLLQVYQIGSRTAVVEVQRPTASFSVADLRPATAYKIIVTAVNDKGTSRSIELKAYTIRVPETQEETSAEPARDRERGAGLPLALGVGGGVVTVPVVVALAVMLWMKAVRRNSSARRLSTHSKDAPSTALCSEVSPHEDHNPDLICHTPDPDETPAEHLSPIATITTAASCFVHNGGPHYPGGQPASLASCAGAKEYTQVTCSDRSHCHSHHLSAATAPNVPYFPDQQQPKKAGDDCAAGDAMSTATLERRRPTQCDHDAYDPGIHTPFPHLYAPPSLCHTPHGSQYSLSQCLGGMPRSTSHSAAVFIQGGTKQEFSASPNLSLSGTLRRSSQKMGQVATRCSSSRQCHVHNPQSSRESHKEQRQGRSGGGDTEEVGEGELNDKDKRESAV